ncbi:MAG: LIC12162 family protein [Candidatus Marinimicrobia bacterium]|nr:LIC12162 family protein [Candidatus Neomarinimicrobiota bacterium]
MKEIILGQIPDNFDPALHIPISPACFVDHEWVYPKWMDIEFEPDPFQSADLMAKHVEMTTRYCQNYMHKLSTTLNDLNNTEYSEKYWSLLTLPWLLTLVQTTWERQLRLDHFLKNYSDQPAKVVLVRNNVDWDFSDTLSHQQKGVLRHEYNHWLYSRLLENRIPDKWIVSWTDINATEQRTSDRPVTFKQRVQKTFADQILASSVYGIDRFTALFYEVLLLKSLRFKKISHQTINSENLPPINLDWSLDWDTLVLSTLPRCFMSVTGIKKDSSNWSRYYLVGPILWYNENKKRKLAEALINGSKLVVAQHGGSYGTSRFYSFKNAIEYNHHRFISWGWTEQGEHKDNTIPLPAPLLSRFTYKKSGKKVILITTRAMMYSYRISPIPQAAQQLAYRESKAKFIEHLSDQVYSNLFYRPPLNELGSISDRAYFEDRFKGLSLLEGNLHRETMRCRLLVLDHPDTTLNIALSANVPTICFWDSKIWAMCEQAEPYFEELRAAGILFENGQEAAIKVNEIWDDVTEWWNQSSIQTARHNWVSQYALKSRNWRWQWIKALWNL